MSGPPRILIYAELLSNIRQVSVGCSLSSPCSTSTEAIVSTDGQRLTIRHENEDCMIKLPKRVAVTGKLAVQNQSSKSLSWRLPISSATSVQSMVSSQLDSPVPWSASDLRPGSVMKCRNCQTTILNEGKIKVWKDLPSENWAEMMEFWHCHKPDNHDHSGTEEHLTGRGYGANSRLTGQTGIGFVDLISFLFFEEDCINLKIATTGANSARELGDPVRQGISVCCNKCETDIGVIHKETASVTLYKWQLSMLSSVPGSQAEPSLPNCVASLLVSTLSRSGSSKSVILPLNSLDTTYSENLLHIWLFNGDITFSSSALESVDSITGIKVLYQLISKEEAERMSESLASNVQDIALPSIAIADLKQLFIKSNKWLTEGDRQFRGWTVGLLEKWKSQ